jgi:hypothetical protein
MTRFPVALLIFAAMLMLSLAGSMTDARAAPKQCYKGDQVCERDCFSSGNTNCSRLCDKKRNSLPRC